MNNQKQLPLNAINEKFIPMKRIDENENTRIYRGNRNLVVGVVLILIGIAVFFKSLGILPYETEEIIFSWQMLLIAIGVLMISASRSRIGGFILIIIGVFFLLEEFSGLSGQMRSLFWAFFFIFIGLVIMFRAFRTPSRRTHWHTRFSESESLDYVDEIAIFGGSEKRIQSQNFSGGHMTNIFGGSTFDFTDARLAPGKQILDIVSIFGGFKLIVPSDWNIKLEVTAILGGVSDKRSRVKENLSDDRVLIIRGIAIFGGGEIKSY